MCDLAVKMIVGKYHFSVYCGSKHITTLAIFVACEDEDAHEEFTDAVNSAGAIPEIERILEKKTQEYRDEVETTGTCSIYSEDFEYSLPLELFDYVDPPASIDYTYES